MKERRAYICRNNFESVVKSARQQKSKGWNYRYNNNNNNNNLV